MTHPQDDEGTDLLDSIDHLDADASTVTLRSRDGTPVVIWVDDMDGIDEFLEGE